MKHQNNAHNSTERWIEAQYIRQDDGSIESFPSYMISDRGRVASVKGKAKKILTQHSRSEYGHLQVGLCINNKLYFRSVHRLVLSSFHPEQYFEGAEVDHLDRDPTNNFLSNLHWTDSNGNCANRGMNPLKKIRVTHLDDGHTEEFSNMKDCSKAFGKSAGWCNSVIILLDGFVRKYNIKIEKIEK